MNIVILSGRLTKDADVRRSASGDNMAIARFSLAVDRKGKKEEGQQTADFINCVAFGKTAEVIEKHTSKGTKIMVRGRWQTGSYKSNKDGSTVYTNDCIVDEFEFAESKKDTQGSAPSAPEYGKPDQDGWMNVPDGIDEELPFN